MIEFGKITGETSDNLLQVRMRTGESLFAPMIVVGNNVSLPSKDWIKANKDNFLALVTYEKDMLISPMIIGFYPVKNADSSAYNVTEKLLSVILELIEQLIDAKVSTQTGPQPFMPDTISVFNNLKSHINEISKTILSLKL